jgi:hypothetical protein
LCHLASRERVLSARSDTSCAAAMPGNDDRPERAAESSGKGTEPVRRPVLAGPTRTWQPVGVDSDLERGPSSIPAVSHRGGHLELLPLEVLPWPDFESLQWRILRDGPPRRSWRLDRLDACHDRSGFLRLIKRFLELFRRNSAAVRVKPLTVVPCHPFHGGDRHIHDSFPRPVEVDELSFVQTVQRLRSGISAS